MSALIFILLLVGRPALKWVGMGAAWILIFPIALVFSIVGVVVKRARQLAPVTVKRA